MYILKKIKSINDWRIIYVGIKNEWISVNEVISLCEKGHIICNDEILIQIYTLDNLSPHAFLKMLENSFIDKNNVFLQVDISKTYYLFWAIEFLLQITEKKSDIFSKLFDVTLVYADFNYPSIWDDFICFMPAEPNEPIGEDIIYSKLLEYIQKSIEKLKEKNILS